MAEKGETDSVYGRLSDLKITKNRKTGITKRMSLEPVNGKLIETVETKIPNKQLTCA